MKKGPLDFPYNLTKIKEISLHIVFLYNCFFIIKLLIHKKKKKKKQRENH